MLYCGTHGFDSPHWGKGPGSTCWRCVCCCGGSSGFGWSAFFP